MAFENFIEKIKFEKITMSLCPCARRSQSSPGSPQRNFTGKPSLNYPRISAHLVGFDPPGCTG